MLRRAWLLLVVLVVAVLGATRCAPCHAGWLSESPETDTPAPPPPPPSLPTEVADEEVLQPVASQPLGAAPAEATTRNTESHNNIIRVPVWNSCPEGQSRDRRGKCRAKW